MPTVTYFLTTARLGLRTWTADDLDLAWALWGDPRVTALIGGPFDAAQVRERLARKIATESSERVQYWPLFRLDDGAHVGCCGLRPRGASRDLRELGFH